MSNFLRHYFGLGLLDRELVLGPDDNASHGLSVGLVVAMYVGVLFGVMAAYLLEATRDAGAGFPILNAGGILRGLLVATLLYPLVAPKIMNLAGGDPNSPGDTGNPTLNRVLQFCIAVQNGFFWEAVLL